jgi:hypothetical protein
VEDSPNKYVKKKFRVNQGVLISDLPGGEFIEITMVKVFGSKTYRRAKILARSEKTFHTLEIGRKPVSLGFDVEVQAGEAETPRYLVELVISFPKDAKLARV